MDNQTLCNEVMMKLAGAQNCQIEIINCNNELQKIYSMGVEDNIAQTTTQTTTQTTKILSDVQMAIIEYIHSHPNASRKEIAANISGITENGVKYHMQKL